MAPLDVRLDQALVRESLAANVTSVGLFLRVNAHMNAQRCHRFQRLFAHAAGEINTIFGVDQAVLFECYSGMKNNINLPI